MGTKTSSAGPHGVVVIDKPAGWTSHDVVAKSRGVIGTRKVGHSGTLDPDATGVLVLGVGHATRLLRFLTELPKRYEGEIVLGTETTTLDAAGEITATHDMSAVTDDQVRAAANRLTGDLMQVPPMVSAIKIDGKRLHELAREGKEVDRPPRPVRVDRFDVEPVEERAACGVVSSTARREPTFARWLLISALRSAGVHICAHCDAHRWVVSRLTMPARSSHRRSCRSQRRFSTLSRSSSTRTLPCWWVTVASFRSNSCRSPVGVRGR